MRDSSICSDCALKQGLIWPEGHLATFCMDICDHCGQHKAVCSIYDYDGPHMDGKCKEEVRD